LIVKVKTQKGMGNFNRTSGKIIILSDKTESGERESELSGDPKSAGSITNTSPKIVDPRIVKSKRSISTKDVLQLHTPKDLMII
jgi:hypothetical protein